MAYSIEKTKNELIKRFTDNGWEPLELEMKCGGTIEITPCWYGDKTPEKPEECEWFLMGSADVNLNGDERIEKIAEILNNFEEIRNKSKSDKIKCDEFYKEHIAGHTKAEEQLGQKIYNQVYAKAQEGKTTSFSDEFIDTVLPEIAGNLNIDTITAKNALQLVFDEEYHYEWYQDLYGYKPL